MTGPEWAAIVTAVCGAVVSVVTVIGATIVQYVKIKEHVQEVGEHADRAYKEANSFNQKLKAIAPNPPAESE